MVLPQDPLMLYRNVLASHRQPERILCQFQALQDKQLGPYVDQLGLFKSSCQSLFFARTAEVFHRARTSESFCVSPLLQDMAPPVASWFKHEIRMGNIALLLQDMTPPVASCLSMRSKWGTAQRGCLFSKSTFTGRPQNTPLDDAYSICNWQTQK